MKIFSIFSICAVCCLSSINARRLMVIRHGEKISDDYLGLNDVGEARAHCLYKVFNKNTVYGEPQSIYSNKRGNRSHRPYDTVKPLADRLGLQVQEFHKYDPQEFVKNTLNKDNSSIILLSSAREWIPSLIEAIGYKVSDDIDEFDNIWLIENDDKKGGGKVTIKKQHLEECMESYLNALKTTKKTTTTKKKTTTKTTTKIIKTTRKPTTKLIITKKTTNKKATTKYTINKNTAFKVSTKKSTSTTSYKIASEANQFRCGSNYKAVCPKGYCCSKYYYCGKSSEHCGVGCRPQYGLCM